MSWMSITSYGDAKSIEIFQLGFPAWLALISSSFSVTLTVNSSQVESKIVRSVLM